jgi:hypothetical protein
MATAQPERAALSGSRSGTRSGLAPPGAPADRLSLPQGALGDCAGSQFDPAVVDAVLEVEPALPPARLVVASAASPGSSQGSPATLLGVNSPRSSA